MSSPHVHKFDMDGYCIDAACPASCEVTWDAETQRPKPDTSERRADLDESDSTARECDACGRWTVAGETYWSGEECFTLCPACFGGKNGRL